MNLGFDLTITVASILAVVFAVVGWVQMGRKAVAERIANVADRLDRHEHRLTTLEQTVVGLPAKDHIHELRLELSKMAGELREMRAVMNGNNQIMGRLETIVTRHEDHLLDGVRR